VEEMHTWEKASIDVVSDDHPLLKKVDILGYHAGNSLSGNKSVEVVLKK
jgi:hypothetical protein